METVDARVGDVLNSIRVPVSERSPGANPDTEHLILSVEVKSRENPTWLEDAMTQAETSATDNELPVVVLHQDGIRYEDALVVTQLKNFAELMAGAEKPEAERAEEVPSSPIATVYTDGGCLGHVEGRGAWAAVIYDEDPKPMEIWGSERHTTNSRMELRAAIEALKALKEPRRVRVHSDSAYLVNAFEMGWIDKWQGNGWKTSRKKPVENQDLWRELLDLTTFHDVEWVKVPGHAGVPGNERANSLVQMAMARRME